MMLRILRCKKLKNNRNEYITFWTELVLCQGNCELFWPAERNAQQFVDQKL